MVNSCDKTRVVRWLTYCMFMMFAMTTDAVGVIIPKIISEFNLSLTQASAFHYVSMAAIAISGIAFGSLADRIGRKSAIIVGLFIFTIGCFAFSFSEDYAVFVALLALCGAAIGIFKTAALALIGDLTANSHQHSKTMNTVEGFFAVGAIIGPALVAFLLARDLSWKYLYAIAGIVCFILLLLASRVDYPVRQPSQEAPSNLAGSIALLKDPYALGFSLAIGLYVAVEVAIYVWMPSFLAQVATEMPFLVAYALTIFFILRAAGRFLGAWLLDQFHWAQVLCCLTGAIALCFLASVLGGAKLGVYLLPLSGLFMSMVYPTLNSKGISCFPKHRHGAIAGVLLFFTALAAALGPLAMALMGDYGGDVRFGFYLAAAFALGLFALMAYNLWANPTAARLAAVQQGQD
ncbi:MAG: MFS transporter [Marinagarivorans sp.]